MKENIARIISNIPIAEGIYAMQLHFAGGAKMLEGVKSGQFLNVGTGDGAHLLKRPLGIVKCEGESLTVCYQVKGSGTVALSKRRAGEILPVLLPLGNGFEVPESAKNIALIGGGVGIFPLVSLFYKYPDKKFHSFLGFRSQKYACLLEEFEKSASLEITSDDATIGKKGNAVQAFVEAYMGGNCPKCDLIISCGPPVMFKALKKTLQENKIDVPCKVSLEERMGCGLGACLVCVCKKTDGRLARVCKDGPVFDINEVEL